MRRTQSGTFQLKPLSDKHVLTVLSAATFFQHSLHYIQEPYKATLSYRKPRVTKISTSVWHFKAGVGNDEEPTRDS